VFFTNQHSKCKASDFESPGEPSPYYENQTWTIQVGKTHKQMLYKIPIIIATQKVSFVASKIQSILRKKPTSFTSTGYKKSDEAQGQKRTLWMLASGLL